jgi:hypothetical protein
MEAHYAEDYRRMALDAGTALEHLVKACLAVRSPALLVELKSESNFYSLLSLLGLAVDHPLRQVRTVGLRDALQRVKSFVLSPASDADIRTLVDLRDGTVHAALNAEVEERLLVAFVQHADALLNDLRRDRSDFWDSQLDVVDALLADTDDEIQHRVDVMLAAGRARAEQRYGKWPAEVRELIVESIADLEGDREFESDEAGIRMPCPACGSPAAMYGTHESGPGPAVHFYVYSLGCRICGLRLNSKAELHAAGIGTIITLEFQRPSELELVVPDPDPRARAAWLGFDLAVMPLGSGQCQ